MVEHWAIMYIRYGLDRLTSGDSRGATDIVGRELGDEGVLLG